MSAPRVLAIVVALLVLVARPAAADEGWTVDSFRADIAVMSDASLVVNEAIDVDFGARQQHGIFRDLAARQSYDARSDRVYTLTVDAVTDANGAPVRWRLESADPWRRIRIGDPDRLVSGTQSYRIRYRLADALNHFADHDELYWNVTGSWPVAIRATTVALSLPGGGLTGGACYQGRSGSTEPCARADAPDRIDYRATRPLASGEGLTVVAGIRSGVVAAPRPALRPRPRTAEEYFSTDPLPLAAAGATLLGGLGVLGYVLWRAGRDRRYRTLYYLTHDPSEEERPLFAADQVVVEYEPPDGLRPAELGLILDERADAKDLTATIVDLAVRGYLKMEQHEEGVLVFKDTDWTLTRLPHDDAELRDYERSLLAFLFATGTAVHVSALKGRFGHQLEAVEEALYRDAMERGWFAHDPHLVRTLWAALGVVIAVLGAGLAFALGAAFGLGLVGVAVIAVALATLLTYNAIPSRTAKGSEALRRTLGFRRYLVTAEQERQRFAEREKIFNAYLPYAIVFGCVDRWVRAFRELDAKAATASWYTGTGAFAVTDLSRSLQSFSTSVPAALAATPGGSGASGFAGGFAGGGGGGGGGGSW